MNGAYKPMAPATAMRSTASVMTLPNARGLRPTASEAFIPTSPTPMAEPRPQRPTWMLPLISANMGVIVVMYYLSLFPAAPAVDHGQAAESLKLIQLNAAPWRVPRHGCKSTL